MALAPIVLFTYNRPEHTRRTLEALQSCDLAAESDLIVFSDGPRSEKDKSNVLEVRELLDSITGFRSIKVYPSTINKGLANSVISGVSKVVEEYGKVIVLEDDLVVKRNFISYMNHYLELYIDEDKVISIHAYVYPISINSKAPFFIQGADCWGWATWKRAWHLFEEDAHSLYERISKDKELAYRFDFDGSYPYTKMLKDQIDGKIDSWAIRWYASAFINAKLTLYPPSSLVMNIGMDGSGTHIAKTSKFEDDKVEELSHFLPVETISQDETMYKAFSRFFKSLSPSLFKRILNRLSL